MMKSSSISCEKPDLFSHHGWGDISDAKNQIVIWSEGSSFGLDSIFHPPPHSTSSSESTCSRPIIPSGIRKILTIQLLRSSELDYGNEEIEESQDSENSEENEAIHFFDTEEGDY